MSTKDEVKSVTLPEGQLKRQAMEEKHQNTSIVKNQTNCPLDSDVWTYRITVSGLVTAVLVVILSSSALQAAGKEPPQLLTYLGTGAMSGLAALLAPSTARRARGNRDSS